MSAKNSSSVALPNKSYFTCTYYIAQKGTNKYFADFGSPCLPDFDFEYQHFPPLLVSSSILLSSPKNHSFLLLPRLTLPLPSAAKKVVSLFLRNEDFCFRRPYLAFPPPPSFPIFNFSHPVSKIHPRSFSSSSSSAGFHRSEERREDFLPSPFFARLVPRKNDVKDNRGIRTLTPMRKFSISHKNRYRSTMQRLCFAFFCICLCIVCMSHNIWSQTRRTKRRKEFLADFGSSIHPRRPLRHPTHPPPPPPPNNQPFRCHSHILFKSFHFPSIPTEENSSFVNYHHAPSSTTFPFLFPPLPITPPTFSSFSLDVRDLTPK